ncbi:c-type cytochrome [Pseudoxanthomonas composti]|uniref:Cytochrome c n=1 Tax=Pseudoxanthomonas composti TaxID=2137479 RepID=A0A4Q1JXI1_9GAMM|nr:cytochrome c [Pseudoxanthomonas composti]RXR06500.1 cytochrome c [Pseudoxanthomonas composti]
MRRGLLPSGLALVLLAVQPASHADEAFAMQSTGQFSKADGATIYRHVCQGCHMPEGQGASQVGHYPALAGNPTLASPHYVAMTILQGRKNMPAFGVTPAQLAQTRGVALTDAQVADVTNYLRTHFGNRYEDRISAADVAELRRAAGE